MNDPETYSHNNQPQKIRVEAFFKNYGEDLKKEFDGKEIDLLDIGVGCGKILNEVIIAQSGLKFSNIVAVDVNEDMLKYSIENYGSEPISFEVLDAGKELPDNFKNRKFDLITSFFCIHWINDFNVLFENIRNLLKPNGIFCCIFFQVKRSVAKNLEEADDAVRNLVQYENRPNFRIEGDPSEVVRGHLSDNNMEVVHMTYGDDAFIFEDLDAIKGFSDPLAPNLANLPDEEKLSAFGTLTELFEMEFEDDKLVFGLRTVTFMAKKLADD
ncbi:juvenile hormone acid O-methyltransferase-like [Chironomus tepperi]|uniref:juvenile hormone acid O-methyltransferase-like n=1 Tax=Chironomus tepperi TaxID=113505 RepID=UPI00391EF24B